MDAGGASVGMREPLQRSRADGGALSVVGRSPPEVSRSNSDDHVS
jgi:hypothetical protein